MLLHGELQTLLDEVSQGVSKLLGKKLHAAILFGSYARGDYDEGSDVDIALIIDCPRVRINEYLDGLVDIACEAGLEYGAVVSFSSIPLEEYRKWLPVLPFYQNIDREGVRFIA